MKFEKAPTTFDDQISKLLERGLIIQDIDSAKKFLHNVSYYRLRAYTYPYQDNTDLDHPFISNITFEQIVDIYNYDSKLRFILLDALEKLEIAFRTQIIYHYAQKFGSHWHLNEKIFHSGRFNNLQNKVTEEVGRSKEDFINHYKTKYTDPEEPASWMSLEVVSFGLLYNVFVSLSNSPEKDRITRHFGLLDFKVFQNWMHCFFNLRNTCAHHSRLWNRRLIQIKIPTHTVHQFLDNRKIYPNKLYAAISCLEYLLRIINVEYSIKDKINDFLSQNLLIDSKEMGFPINWQDDSFWK